MFKHQIAAQIEEKGTLLGQKMAEAEANPTAELATEITSLNDEIDALEEQMKSAPDIAEIKAKNEARLASVQTVTNRPQMPTATTGVKTSTQVQVVNNARVSDIPAGSRQEKEAKMYGFGRFLLASQLGDKSSIKWCQDNGIELKAANEGINSQGGVLVPHQFENYIIDLREEYGVFRRNARVSVMTSDSKSNPRRTGGLTAYALGEAQAITDSTKGWDLVQLNAKKWGVLSYVSSEVNEDSIINWASDLANEIAYAFSVKEDECGFNGDGTSTYHGITGVRAKLLNLSATRANIAGLHVGTGNAYSELTLNDFINTAAKLPVYARSRNPKWYASHVFYESVMVRLMLAAGGVTAAEIAAGRLKPTFLGHDVELSVAMPQTEANDQVCALFGALPLAADFGDRRGTSVAVSEHTRFAEDQIAIRGTTRFDINVHDVGNASGTASARVPGPIVGLLTAAA